VTNSLPEMVLDRLLHPIVLAPMGGGPSTPELAAAVSGAGGLGFLAAGYKSTAALADEIRATRALGDAPFGVNLFAPGAPADPGSYLGYVAQLEQDAGSYGVEPGEPRYTDDEWDAKLELMEREEIAVVSITFGLPARSAIERLQKAGCEVWITVTDPSEAEQSALAGADALIVQGAEAGAHRGTFDDAAAADPFGLLALLQLVAARVEVPLIAAGGIASGRAVAAATVCGAAAVQVGTVFMLAPEAGTSDVHRMALKSDAPTALTRAFTGRRARGIVNRFIEDHPEAPSAYPEIHYATAPIRAAARAAGDREAVNLWAGQAHELALELPAAEIVETLADDARRALEASTRRLGPGPT
jgi:nitronate monooxygenase